MTDTQPGHSTPQSSVAYAPSSFAGAPDCEPPQAARQSILKPPLPVPRPRSEIAGQARNDTSASNDIKPADAAPYAVMMGTQSQPGHCEPPQAARQSILKPPLPVPRPRSEIAGQARNDTSASNPEQNGTKSFYVHNLGCKVNRVESDAIALALAGAGGQSVSIDSAAVVLINTCTVTGEAEAKTRKAIRQALAAPGRPWVVATGCAIAINRDGFAALGERVIAEPDRELARQRALQLLGLAVQPDSNRAGIASAPVAVRNAAAASTHATASTNLAARHDAAANPTRNTAAASTNLAASPGAVNPTAAVTGGLGKRRLNHSAPSSGQSAPASPGQTPPLPQVGAASARTGLGQIDSESGTEAFIGTSLVLSTRRGIKIQDGCDNQCSYCIVRIARGPARSVPAASLVGQLQAVEQEGVREAVLTGVNIGAYLDRGSGQRLPELLELLLAGTDRLRIRLSSLEPQYASDRLLQLMAASGGRVCAHLHLPLQSGSDRTLSTMKRHYDTAGFAERVQAARSLMPQLALTTDIIVGFPGESDQDFADSLEFCRSLRFSKAHVFRFSCRPQTAAAGMPGHLDAATISRRAAAMRDLAAQMRQLDLGQRLDKSEQVLVERHGRGTSESYHQVAAPPDAVIGSLSLMRFVGCRDNLLLAEMPGNDADEEQRP